MGVLIVLNAEKRGERIDAGQENWQSMNSLFITLTSVIAEIGPIECTE